MTAHSEKEEAAPNVTKGFGFGPLVVLCDNTNELVAIRLPGQRRVEHRR